MLIERKVDKMDFSVYEHTSSEESGESSRTKNHSNLNPKAACGSSSSEQKHHPKSGHSIKGLEL